jgi:hypothetical protein
MQFELELRYVEGLLNYLAARPWGEVQALLPPLIQQLEAAQAQQQAQQRAGEAQDARVVPIHQPA